MTGFAESIIPEGVSPLASDVQAVDVTLELDRGGFRQWLSRSPRGWPMKVPTLRMAREPASEEAVARMPSIPPAIRARRQTPAWGSCEARWAV